MESEKPHQWIFKPLKFIGLCCALNEHFAHMWLCNTYASHLKNTGSVSYRSSKCYVLLYNHKKSYKLAPS